MVSIILPAYNSEDYISKAIESVLLQSFQKWELLVINDGSTDDSKKVILSFNDLRIRYIEQENKGVSAARNVGLRNMKGNFFCFLDADDVFPENSLKSRFKVFENNPDLEFVDGTVHKMNYKMDAMTGLWKPNWTGNPLKDLMKLNGKAFFGPTWLVKRKKNKDYYLKEGMSHGEDLLFYMQLARAGGKYSYTRDVVLFYRNTPGSAMKDFMGLEEGYRNIERIIGGWEEVSHLDHLLFKLKYKKAMFLAYFRSSKWKQALKAIF